MGQLMVDSCSFWVLIQFFKIMILKNVDLSKVLNDDHIYDHVMENYDQLGTDWIKHQWNWINNVYLTFKDHYKYMIVISLVEKTMQFYDQMNIQLTYDQFYSNSYIQIEKFSITELCEKLSLPKETVRRKVLELEKLGVLKRQKKKIIIDRSAFDLIKPQNQIKLTSRYIFLVSKILNSKKIYAKKLDIKYIEGNIKKNFSLVWRWFYRMQIPMMIGYRSLFADLSTFHVWGTVCMNQAFNYKKKINDSNIHTLVPDYLSFNKNILSNSKVSNGVSAMSISDMTNIPRATVIRKCKFLVENDFLFLNDKKQYFLTGLNYEKIYLYQKKFFKDKSKFLRKTLNLLLIS
jgi:DNA-binding transcriptional regulator GbsR (MarR family)